MNHPTSISNPGSRKFPQIFLENVNFESRQELIALALDLDTISPYHTSHPVPLLVGSVILFPFCRFFFIPVVLIGTRPTKLHAITTIRDSQAYSRPAP